MLRHESKRDPDGRFLIGKSMTPADQAGAIRPHSVKEGCGQVGDLRRPKTSEIFLPSPGSAQDALPQQAH